MKTQRFVHGLIMLLGDAAVFFTTLYLALVLRNFALPSEEVYIEHVSAFLALFFVYEVVLYIAGFWGRRIIPTAKNIFELLVPAHVMATVIMVLYFYALSSLNVAPKTSLVIFTALLFVGIYAWKLMGLRFFTMYPIRAILIGKESRIKDAFENQPLWNVKIVEKFSYQVGLERLQNSLADNKADTILVSFDRYPRIDILYKLMFANISILDTVKLREEIESKIDLEYIDQNWFLNHVNRQSGSYRFIKRFLDVFAGLILGLVCLIVAPMLYIAVKLEDGGPLVITQKRIGLRGHEFNFYKFRSMSVDNDDWKNKNKKVTQVGAFIRKTRIDELAQFWNIVKGDISLVGPRAILTREHKDMVKKNPFQQARLLAQPGLTGWAQVQQKHAPENEEEAAERLAYDLYYIKNISLWLDIKIILRTVKKLLQKTGMK